MTNPWALAGMHSSPSKAAEPVGMLTVLTALFAGNLRVSVLIDLSSFHEPGAGLTGFHDVLPEPGDIATVDTGLSIGANDSARRMNASPSHSTPLVLQPCVRLGAFAIPRPRPPAYRS
jgi:hypothetical protein